MLFIFIPQKDPGTTLASRQTLRHRLGSEQILDGPAYYPLHHRSGRLKAGGKRQAHVRSFAVTSDSRKSEAFRV